MRPEPGHAADWRDAAAYAPLLEADRSVFAWEWLRRDPAYRAAAERAVAKAAGPRPPAAPLEAARWGLHAFEPPNLGAPSARPVWCRKVYPFVLEAGAAEGGQVQDRLDLERLKRFVTLVEGDAGSEHLLLSDGRSTIRVDIVAGTVRERPSLLVYRLSGLTGLKEPLLVLRQLLALWRTGDFSPALHLREQRAARWILMLRAHDALVAGAGQREIAARLLGHAAAERRWRVEAPSLRSRAQRLAREARRMAAGAYLSMLGRR